MTDDRTTHLDENLWLSRLREMQSGIRDSLLTSLRDQGVGMAVPAPSHDSGDTAYVLDAVAETVLLPACREWAVESPFLLVSEGVSESGRLMFPEGAGPESAAFTLVVDPVDGTRELMYDKRSAWSLAGIAPGPPEGKTLADIQLAVQTELPTTRHRVADTFWAVSGRGASAERTDLCSGQTSEFTPRPSSAPSIRHGFASLVKYFPGDKVDAAQLEQALFEAVLGEGGPNPLAFDDQYLTSAGQLWQVFTGQSRFCADLRPVFADPQRPRLTAHPYDLCTELIAREAGVLVTDEKGEPLRSPLDIHASVGWMAFANASIRDEVWPVLHRLLGNYIF